ncbi:MAG: 2-hydroxychromene-2-carboxylate isomerase, partial [Pseudomonadota bacterium]
MSGSIDYYFTCHSPFTWFGHNAFIEVAKKHKKTINYKPVNLMEVWKVSGAVAPPQRPPMRQRYRLIELQRVAEFRGLTVIPQPDSFPTNPERADLCCAVLVQQGKDPGPFLFSVGEALWAQDRQIADEDLLAELLDKHGHDGRSIVAASKDDSLAHLRSENAQAAVDIDVVGVPSYVYQGEVF